MSRESIFRSNAAVCDAEVRLAYEVVVAQVFVLDCLVPVPLVVLAAVRKMVGDVWQQL